VGVPLPTKSRAGVSIPQNQQRARRQVQIFDSQPLSSPGRSATRSSIEQVGLNGSLSLNGSYVAQMQMTRSGSGYATGTAGSLSSSAPKVPSGLSNSAPRNNPDFQEQKTAQMFAAKGITAVPPRVVNSPSTSSSSSSISSAIASTTAGTSSLVSTPPTSLSHSLGNVVIEFMGTGKFESELRTGTRISPTEGKNSEEDDRYGLVISPKKTKTKSDLEKELSSAISSSWKATDVISGSWKEKVSGSFASYKSNGSLGKASKRRSNGPGHNRSHSGLSNAGFWKDPGTSAPAPAVLVSAVVGADGREDDFTKVSMFGGKSTPASGTSSATATVARPSPVGTPLPIMKKSNSIGHGPSRLIHDTSHMYTSATSATDSRSADNRELMTNSSQSNTQQPLSLLTQTAPRLTSPSKRAIVRVSPPQQVSQLSAHMHLHKPSTTCTCLDALHKHPSHARSKTKSRSSRLIDYPSIAGVSPTSVTPTPASPSPAPPPPTPIDALAIATLIPPPVATSNPPANGLDAAQQPSQPRTVPHLRTPVEDKPLPPPISIKIADLGNATPSQKHFTEDIQTRQYRAPEAILGRRDWDARADIWSVACVVSKIIYEIYCSDSDHRLSTFQVFELLTAEYLFDPQGQGELFSKDDDHIAQIIELLGDFSLEVKMGGKYSRELFDHSGSSLSSSICDNTI